MRKRLTGLTAGLFVVFMSWASTCHGQYVSNIVQNVSADAYVEDFERSGVLDGIPDRISNTNALLAAKGIVDHGIALESRSVIIFDLRAYKKGTALKFASLSGQGARVDRYTGEPINVKLFAYAGDGVVSLEDFNTPAVLVTEFSLPGSKVAFQENFQLFEIDVTETIQKLLNQGAQFAEFRMHSEGLTAYVAAGEVPPDFLHALPGPQLSLFFAPTNTFLRGDSNGDGHVDISDPKYLLDYVYNGGPAPKCKDAADANDDGILDVNDAKIIFSYLFSGGVQLPAPSTKPGFDLTLDNLSCNDPVAKGPIFRTLRTQ